MTLRTLDLFAGSGGFTLACEMAGGYETAAFCEIEPYAQKVLAARWPSVPIHSDVTKLKASHIDGTIDVITGGFPCQDLSSAGAGAGIGDGTRSGLFREMLRLGKEFERKQGYLPCIVFENVSRLLSGPTEDPGQWFGEFLHSLAEVGYDAEWFCITAASIGAPHERERVCVVAYASEMQCNGGKADGYNRSTSISKFGGSDCAKNATHAYKALIQGGSISRRVYAQHADFDSAVSQWSEWGGGEPEICGVDDGVPKGSHTRRSGIMGNAIVPQVFAIVMRALREAHEEAHTA